jgi:uncharacterized protein with GYD domain
MARFLFQGSYSTEGIKGVLKEGGTGRRAAVEAAVKSVGGTVESYYFAFGETDVFVIVHGIDNEAALAFALGVGASGGLHSLKTTVLLTPEEVDEAAKKTLSYRAPGR